MAVAAADIANTSRREGALVPAVDAYRCAAVTDFTATDSLLILRD